MSDARRVARDDSEVGKENLESARAALSFPVNGGDKLSVPNQVQSIDASISDKVQIAYMSSECN